MARLCIYVHSFKIKLLVLKINTKAGVNATHLNHTREQWSDGQIWIDIDGWMQRNMDGAVMMYGD